MAITYKSFLTCESCRHFRKESCPYFGLPILPTDYPCPDFEHKNWRIPRKVRYFFKHYDNLLRFKMVFEKKLGFEAFIVRGRNNFRYLVVRIPRRRKIRFGRFYAISDEDIILFLYVKNWTKTWRPVSLADIERQLSDDVVKGVLSKLGIRGKVVKVFACQKPLLPMARKFLAERGILYMNYTHDCLVPCITAFVKRIIWKLARRIRYCPKCGQERLFLKFRKRPTCPSCGHRPYMSKWLLTPPCPGPEYADITPRQKIG